MSSLPCASLQGSRCELNMFHGALLFFTFIFTSALMDSSLIFANESLCVSGSCVTSRRVTPEPTSFGFEGDYFWIPVGWTPCSAKCGGGTQRAVADCFASNLTKVPPLNCEHLIPVDVEKPCNLIECPTYSVHRPPWSECSRTCGTGYQTREVLCRDSLGLVVSSANCDLEDNFIESQECNTEPCGESQWTVPQWSPCDAPCGGGKQRRIPTCNSSGLHMATCIEVQPATQRLCNTQSCETHAWLVGPWQACPYSCDARTNRLVQCVDGYGFEQPDSECPGKKPANSISCEQSHLSCTDCLYNCFGHGVCQRGSCSCDGGWSGRYCHSPSTCDGFLGYSQGDNVHCCGLVDVNQRCCSGSLDKDGNCCPSGVLDRRGVCDGPATMIDFEGKPCSSIRDEKGICCASGVLDECLICDGDGTSCSTRMTLYINVTGNSGGALDAGAFGLFLKSSMDRVAQKLRVSTNSLSVSSTRMLSPLGEECKLDALVDSPCSQNEFFSGLAVVNVTVLPSSPEIFIRRADVISVLQPGPLSSFDFFPEVLHGELLFLGDVKRGGVCGNGLCERGERCTADGISATTSSSSCCLQDCPFVSTSCLAPITGPRRNMTCSGYGVCYESTGECDCFRGYTGSDCSDCAPGWIKTQTGACALLPVAETLSKLSSFYKGELMHTDSVLRPSTVSKEHRNGFDATGKAVLLFLVVVCLGLLVLLALAVREERARPEPPPACVKVYRGDCDDVPDTFPRWRASYLGPQSEYDVIPITPRASDETRGTAEGSLRRWSPRRSFFGGNSSSASNVELQTVGLKTDEDLTEEEQSKMSENMKREFKRGKSPRFVTGYLTDSDSDSDEVEDKLCEGKHVHVCTPESPAIAR